jgi:5-oxoprolinase (ATP-hydrolysing) subunit C
VTAAVEILETAPVTSVQDLGRPDYLALGVSLGGTMDRLAAQVSNAMVGNPNEAACLEVGGFPFRLRFHRRLKVALTGADCEALLNERPLPPWWTFQVHANDELALNPPIRGRYCYVALAGGIDIPPILGSRSTDIKTGIGGFEGRGLRPGDRLEIGSPGRDVPAGEFGVSLSYPLLPHQRVTRLRVLAAAEFDALTEDSRTLFSRAKWKVTSAFNRTGAKLDGARLSLIAPRDVLSYGVVPGLIQVPPLGKPIIQLAEANTCGGYPRIGTVIGPDLRLVAQTPTGGSVCFEVIDHPRSIAALAEERTALAILEQSLARATTA